MANLEPIPQDLAPTEASISNPPVMFDVADVERATQALPEVPYYEAVEALLQKPKSHWRKIEDETWPQVENNTPQNEAQPKIESCSRYRGRLVAGVQFHPVIAAIHKAFQDHRPLCLSPDMIWLMIGQGLANHVNVHAEELRSRFVEHEGKAKIKVRRDDFIKGSPENPWQEVFTEFSARVRFHIGDVTHDLLVPTFSTTGIIEKAAAEIVLLDAMQSYFEYEFITLCGIPEVKLEGTVNDWQVLLERTQALAKFDLQWWTDILIPILKQFVAAAQGNPDQTFWQSIYKLNTPGSGSTIITGWITAFFPYLKDWNTRHATRQNFYLTPSNEPQLEALLYPAQSGDDHRIGDLAMEDFPSGLTTAEFPSGLAKAPFRWFYYKLEFDMEFLGGFVGVQQDQDDLTLRPEIGWAVRDAQAVALGYNYDDPEKRDRSLHNKHQQ